MASSLPASYSGQSIISPDSTVPSSSSSGSTFYETCPSDSPRARPSSSSSPSPYYYSYEPPPPLPRPPYYDDGRKGASGSTLEGALEGMKLREEEEETSAQPSSNNKPLPRLPPPTNHLDSPSSSAPSTSRLNPREDPSSSRYRAGSTFTTVYNLHSSPQPRPQSSSSSTTTSSGGAADLVLRRRDDLLRQGYSGGPSWNGNGNVSAAAGGMLQGRGGGGGRNDQAQHPSSPSTSSLTNQPSPGRCLPSYQPPPQQQQQTKLLYQPSPPHPSSTSSFHRPPPPPPFASHQYIPFPPSSSSYASSPPPPPPPFYHQPYASSPPPRTTYSNPNPSPNRYPSPRQPSFSALPPRSHPHPSTPPQSSPSARSRPTSTQPSSPFSISSATNTPQYERERARAHSAIPLSASSLSSPSSRPPPHSPSRSTSSDTRIQCSGKTKIGRQCEKRKGANASSRSSSPKKQQAFLASLRSGENGREDYEEEGDTETWYCHLHKDAILRNTGVYVGGRGGSGRVWVEFADWIPPELKDETRIGLMTLMERIPSSSSASSSSATPSSTSTSSEDQAGFVYCFEYRGLSTPTYLVFKIGSSKNVSARLEQWGAQCPSKEPRLLGIVPDEGGGGDGSRLKGLRGGSGVEGDRGGVKGREWFEKLVHLEIASLDPGIRQREECVDCKRFHKEMFRIPRSPPSESSSAGREFEDLVLPVMERWERFVRMVLMD